MRTMTVAVLMALLGVGAANMDANAQVLKRLKDRAAEKIEQKVGEKQDEAIDKTIDGKPAAASTEAETPAPERPADEPRAETATLKPGEGAWANYDFTPGDRILFADDFSRDRVGNFPQRLEFKDGTHEVVEWQERRFIRSTSFGSYIIPLPEVLPEQYTIEFEWAGPGGWTTSLHFGDPDYEDGNYVALMSSMGGIDGKQRSMSEAPGEYGVEHRLFSVRVQVDGDYAKVYMDEKRVANMPNAKFRRANKLRFNTSASTEHYVLVGDIRVGAGGQTHYDAVYETLVTEGRFSTQGIYFDTGSDRVRPESTPTLKEIADMLKKYGDLRLRIEGHTDNTGSAEINDRLSRQRAAAVRSALVTMYAIDGSRLETEGFGSSNPISTNDTPEGRQMNRRVDLVKL